MLAYILTPGLKERTFDSSGFPAEAVEFLDLGYLIKGCPLVSKINTDRQETTARVDITC